MQATFELKSRIIISTNLLKDKKCIQENKEIYATNNDSDIEHDHNYDASSSNFEENKEFIVDNFLSVVIKKEPTKLKVKTKFNKTKSKIVHNCPMCTVELPALELRKHIQTHKSLKKYLNIPKVNENSIFFARPREILLSINKQDNCTYKCVYCAEELSVEDFVTHLQSHKLKAELKCDKCERVFRRMNHLNIHKHQHKDDFSYRCDICKKGFILKKTYDCHLLTHTNVELPHSCEYCGKRFANPLHLRRHIVIHTENRSYNQKYRVWKCKTCLNSFRSREDLKKHQCTGVPSNLPLTNRKSPNFNRNKSTHERHSCTMCPKNFASRSGLYIHVQIKHYGRIIKSLCTVCGKYVGNLTYHMKRHDGIADFKCHLCPKKYFRQVSLKRHLLVHSEVRPYICSSCGKTFNNLYNLQVHERIHIGIKPHLCTMCGKTFLEKSYLKKHMRIHEELKNEK